MKGYKELIEELRMAGRWIKHDDGSEETYLLSVDDCEEIADAIEELVKERDAAVNDLNIARSCLTCKSDGADFCDGCDSWRSKKKWEWRGVQE